MSGQVTAWSLSFSLKLNNYPFLYGTNSTTKWSLGCASTNGEQSQALVTPQPPWTSQGWNVGTATPSACDDKHSPTASQGNTHPSLISKSKKDCTWCSWSNWWLSPPRGDTSAVVVPVRSGVREHLVTGHTLETVTHASGGDNNILWT